MRLYQPPFLLNLISLLFLFWPVTSGFPSGSAAPRDNGDPPWVWKFHPRRETFDIFSDITFASPHSLALFEYVAADARNRKPFSDQAIAYVLGRLSLSFRSDGPGDPPLAWPAIEKLCLDMIGYIEQGTIIQVEGWLMNNLYPEWTIYVTLKILGVDDEGGLVWV